MRNNGQKVNHKEFHPNMRKNLFILGVAEHWNKLVREVMESPFLETHRTNHLDTFLCNLLKLTLPWHGGYPQSSLPILTDL